MFFFACDLAVASWVLGGGERLENVSPWANSLNAIKIYTNPFNAIKN